MSTSVAYTAGAAGAESLIDPAVLARIGDLELVARVVVEGAVSGLHRSPHLGSSMDFAEHRAYMPGDDIRRIDWKLFARSDRHFVKEFEADTNTNLRVLLDVSPSMRYGGEARPDETRRGVQGRSSISKLDYARYLAASLAYLASTQRDRVGLVTFDQDIVEYVPPSARHLSLVLHTLDGLGRRPAGGGQGERATSTPPSSASLGPHSLRPTFQRIGESIQRRSLVLVISDLYEEPRDVLEALAFLRGRGNDLIVFHVLDPRELEFPFSEAANFVDVESGERLPVIPEYLRAQYRALIAAHTAELARLLGESRIDYTLFDTSRPLDHALHSYLATRERLQRVR